MSFSTHFVHFIQKQKQKKQNGEKLMIAPSIYLSKLWHESTTESTLFIPKRNQSFLFWYLWSCREKMRKSFNNYYVLIGDEDLLFFFFFFFFFWFPKRFSLEFVFFLIRVFLWFILFYNIFHIHNQINTTPEGVFFFFHKGDLHWYN